VNAVEVRDLRRDFKVKGSRTKDHVQALAGVNLDIEAGTIHGLLGPNGAGKTTLVKVLATVLLPTSGTASVLGHNVVDDAELVRPLIGLVFGGDRGLYTRLTARHNLDYWAALYNVPAQRAPTLIEELLERVGLAERADERVEGFSRGMKQRLHLARGLVGDPQVLFLDEPTVGLDPVAAMDFRRFVVEMKDLGKTILLTTHDMAEAEDVCDRVSLIDRGEILTTESPATLGRWISRYEWVEAKDVPDKLVDELSELTGIGEIERRADGWVRFQPEADGVSQLVMERLVQARVITLRTGFPSLHEVYVRVVGDRGMEM
jgi:ABC-2 type transport system ATP-binding protein